MHRKKKLQALRAIRDREYSTIKLHFFIHSLRPKLAVLCNFKSAKTLDHRIGFENWKFCTSGSSYHSAVLAQRVPHLSQVQRSFNIRVHHEQEKLRFWKKACHLAANDRGQKLPED